MRPDGKVAYVSCMSGNAVAEIDLGYVDGEADDFDRKRHGRIGMGAMRRQVSRVKWPAGKKEVSRLQKTKTSLRMRHRMIVHG